MSLQFKTPREREEYAQLPQRNPRLFEAVVDLAAYIGDMLKKDTVITSIYRTAQEEAALYNGSPGEPHHSAHFDWKAFDLRSSIYTADEIRGIMNYIESQYKNKDGRPVVIYHQLPGNTWHFHVQLTD